MEKSVNVANEDVIKLILQYLRENGLNRSLLMLQEESGVALNSVSNLESLIADAQMGRWNQVLDVVDTMKLSQDTLFKLYDQIVRELVDLKESKLATSLMDNATPLISMQVAEPENYSRLRDLCKKRPNDSKEIYAGISGDSAHQHLTKNKKRNIVAEALSKDVEHVPQSRLLALIGMAVKWQEHLGMIPPGDQFDVFRNTSKKGSDEFTQCIKTVSRIIKFPEKSHPECVVFTPNGRHLISGSSDGFIEVWNWSLGTLDTELEYQKNDHFMLHDTLITSLATSRDSEIVASGDQEGNVRVWKLDTGECLRRFNNVHKGAITCMCFTRDSLNLLTGSFDSTARMHGLKSGKTLKEFRGHTSTVNAITYSSDGTRVITGSSDGFIKIWDSRTCDCIKSFPAYSSEKESVLMLKPVNALLNFGTFASGELILVCTKSSTIRLLNMSGACIRQFEDDQLKDVSFIDITVSKRNNWIYALGDDNVLYTFNGQSGKLEHFFTVHDKEAIGVFHHPHESVIASWGMDRTIKLLHP
ncbi:WD-repeat domain containing protein [Theileria equi strain WA]|uniref:WD40 repeat-containing protein SMU1 n=1 Tax=Theileria equi strain WA TaxID=1537102 RepID=L0AXZ7_THEEQ|nr:WD-repeat domain containing protein [Theileria equi strain WA]AFZ80420.1 WD-repeat domain containing protein [Theileria equi strain WA]|eukprot:XP_004830086.1 WD-repeat domain containing protein [Theileria equi strain WA]